jgi:hypothetical protein
MQVGEVDATMGPNTVRRYSGQVFVTAFQGGLLTHAGARIPIGYHAKDCFALMYAS